MRKNGKIFWGLFFILAAIYLVVSRIYTLPEVSVFGILLTVFFIWMFINGIRKLDFYEILFSVAFICCIYSKPLGIEELTPWPVLGAALLGSIGLSMIFRKKNTWTWNSGDAKSFNASSNEQCNGEHVSCENNFGSSIKYINSDNFCNAELENNFGSLTVYFDNAVIQGETAFVKMENNFGETVLYIPRVWKINNNLDRTFGSVVEEGRWEGTSSHTLYLQGETNFGSIKIIYI